MDTLSDPAFEIVPEYKPEANCPEITKVPALIVIFPEYVLIPLKVIVLLPKVVRDDVPLITPLSDILPFVALILESLLTEIAPAKLAALDDVFFNAPPLEIPVPVIVSAFVFEIVCPLRSSADESAIEIAPAEVPSAVAELRITVPALIARPLA